jgi:hypothetical protein
MAESNLGGLPKLAAKVGTKLQAADEKRLCCWLIALREAGKTD